jgi:hypothetical protein
MNAFVDQPADATAVPAPPELSDVEPIDTLVDDDPSGWVKRLVATRCPELTDADLDQAFGLPREVAELFLDALDQIAERVGELGQRLTEWEERA